MKKISLPSVPPIDVALFSKMAEESVTEVERIFFEQLAVDEANFPTICGQMYIDEQDNDDGIFFIRRNSHEYELDNIEVKEVETGGYYDSLAEVLGVYLDEINIYSKHITFLEWLRSKSYDCVRYDRNLDNIGG